MTRVHASRPGRACAFPLRFHVDASLLAGEVAAPPALVASYNYHCSKKKWTKTSHQNSRWSLKPL
jgi:hypothetical protein